MLPQLSDGKPAQPSQSASQPLSEVNIAEAEITRLGQQGQMCLQGLTEWKVIYIS